MGDGFYYLHENGCVIFKHANYPMEDAVESTFCRRIWPVNLSERAQAWIIATEALALGANREGVMDLAKKWGLTDEDAPRYLEALKGKITLERDGDKWCAKFEDFRNLQEDHAGFGDTCLEAIADLIRPGLTKGPLPKVAW